MKSILILLSLILSFSVYSQNAEFSAEREKLSKRLSHSPESFAIALEWEWIINGKRLKFGKGVVEIEPNRLKLDTILFRKGVNAKFDTILTNISNSNRYNFEYNTCCDYFNIITTSESQQSDKKSLVDFKIINNKQNKKYLGILADAGILIKEENIRYELLHSCRSAMSSNVLTVSINEVGECQKDLNCRYLHCVFQNYGVEIPYTESSFQIESEIASFLYLPLTKGSLLVSFDIESNKIKIENVW